MAKTAVHLSPSSHSHSSPSCSPSTSSSASNTIPSSATILRPPSRRCPSMSRQQAESSAHRHCDAATGHPRLSLPSPTSSSPSSFHSAHSPSYSPSRPSFPFLAIFLLLFLANPFSISALPRPAEPPLHVPVGSIFMMEKGDGVQKMPVWVKTDPEQLYGIPQQKDIGKHQIQMKGRTVNVEVGEDQQSRCGPEGSTIWLEIVDQRKMAQLTAEEQFKAVRTLLDTLKDVGVRADDVRLFPFPYLAQYRRVSETIHEMDQEEGERDGGGGTNMGEQMAYSVNISCGELSEQASEIISAVAEHGLKFQVVQGNLRKAKTEQQSETRRKETDEKNAAKRAQSSGEGAGGRDDDATSSAVLVSIILVVILFALVAGLVVYWLRNKKQAQKKQTAENGKGSSSAARPASNAAALSPDSQNTATTPMLANDNEMDETKRS